MTDTGRLWTGQDCKESFEEALYNFQVALNEKTEDWRHAVNQEYSPLVALYRGSLISEEAEELVAALKEGNEKNIRKEICDLLYVVFGTVATFGYSVKEDFAKVHENNMLKIETGTVNGVGKLVKDPNHPKVILE